jgi:hypothetical protein
MNGERVSTVPNAIADIAAVSYETSTGKQLPPPLPQKTVKAAKRNSVH